jgi:hypothetical protein
MKKLILYTWLGICTCTFGFGVVLPVCSSVFDWLTSPSYQQTRESQLKNEIIFDSRKLVIDDKLKVLDMLKDEHDTNRLRQIEEAIKDNK